MLSSANEVWKNRFKELRESVPEGERSSPQLTWTEDHETVTILIYEGERTPAEVARRTGKSSKDILSIIKQAKTMWEYQNKKKAPRRNALYDLSRQLRGIQ